MAQQQRIADCRAGEIGTVPTKQTERLSREAGPIIALPHVFRKKASVHVEFTASAGRIHFAFFKILLSALVAVDGATANA